MFVFSARLSRPPHFCHSIQREVGRETFQAEYQRLIDEDVPN